MDWSIWKKNKHWVLHTVILPPEQKQIPLGGCSGVEDEASNLRRLLHLGVAWCVQSGREGLFADPIFSRHLMTSTLSCPQLHASCLKHNETYIHVYHVSISSEITELFFLWDCLGIQRQGSMSSFKGCFQSQLQVPSQCAQRGAWQRKPTLTSTAQRLGSDGCTTETVDVETSAIL